LPETYPNIQFDKNGVCNVCLEYKQKSKKNSHRRGKKELEEILSKYRCKGKHYDCVVGVSGGKDSTYALYLIKEIYKLRPLAVNFNNWFQREESEKNIERAVKKLNVDYISFKPKWNVMKKLFSLFMKKEGQFCVPCSMGMINTVFRIANMEKVPLIIGAASDYDRCPNEVHHHYGNEYLREVVKNGMSIKELDYFLIPHLNKSSSLRILLLPDHLDWNEKEILKTIQGKIGWQNPSKRFFETDCMLYPIIGYLLRKKWGFDKNTIKCSLMIRQGQISRNDAIKKEKKEAITRKPPILKHFLNSLGLPTRDVKDL